MIKNKKTAHLNTINAIFNKYYQSTEALSAEEHDFQLLNAIVDFFRPKNAKIISTVTIRELLDHLIEFEHHRAYLKEYITSIVSEKKFNRMISDADILQDSDFLYEVRKRTLNKVLPYQPQKDTLEYVLNQVFYKESDYIWLYKIPIEELFELFEILNFPSIYDQEKYKEGVLSELLYGIGLLTQRMSGRSMETNIIKMVPEYTHLENPFLGMEHEFLIFEKQLRRGEIQFLNAEDINYKQFQILLKQCFEFINQAYRNSSKYGITLRVNQNLLRIRQQLERVELLASFLVVNKQQDKIYNSIQIGLKIIEYNCYKNNISSLFKQSIQVVSYEITQYTAKTGEHYITETAKEYFKMFRGAIGGGLIVGFLCIIKVLMSKADTSDFGFAFLYSMNYASGFILIYLLKFTLATKQPAMTASAITKAIEEGMKEKGSKEDKHSAFAILFARLSRSQFIAFVGNVAMAFPVALFLIWIIDMATGVNITDTKWHTLLNDINPITSPAIFHASIAGVFLFLSGVISGNISNKNKHNQVYYRIQEHPGLKRTFGINKTNKIAKWFEKWWPGIVSNFWFGVFMGSTYSVGHFLGLNLDIRHITFASGNIALGAYGADFNLPIDVWIWSAIGLVIIGFMNFIVSFLLSLFLAFKSRNLPLREVLPLFKSVWMYFKFKPFKFFFPSKSQ